MVSFILCLLPALLATTRAQAATLTCNTCFGQTETCDFAPGNCQDNKATGGCLSVAEDIKLGGTQNTYFYKQCLSTHQSDIEVPISFTVGNGNYVRINTTRCNTDNCNSAVPGVPKGSTAANGLQCPTCFALNFTVCNSSVTPCTGDETYCMDFTGFLYKSSSFSPFQAKGCTTASPQVIKPGAILTTALYTFDFFWGASVLAEKIPTTPPPTTTPPANTTSPPSTTAASLETTSPTPNKTTTTLPATTTTTATPNATLTTPETTTTTPAPADTTPNATLTTPETTTTTPAPADTTPNATTTTPETTTTTTTPATTDSTPNTTTSLNATSTSPTTTTPPDTNTTNKTTTIRQTTPTPTTITTNKPTAPSKSTTTNKPTTSGASPALGRFSFALYLPGLTGLLLVKLLA
ncbi:uncharacterized protein ACDP82_019376 [Pangshura tecta]